MSLGLNAYEREPAKQGRGIDRRTLQVVAAGVIAALILAIPAFGATRRANLAKPQKQPQTIRSAVRRVIVDVVVTNGKGIPVTGLSAGDFSVFEDGAAQRILSFDSHSEESDPEFVPPQLPPLPAGWFVDLPSGPERGPLFVILLDLLHTSRYDQIRERNELQEFLASKPEGLRFAVFVLADGLHLIQGFTQDTTRLVAAVAPRTSPLPYIFLDATNFRESVSTAEALFDIGRFLSGFPGRKDLIWIAGDFPYFLRLYAGEGATGAAGGMGGLGDAEAQAMNPLLTEETKAAIEILARSQVAGYPVDAQGLIAWGGAYTSQMFEDSIAKQTGGRAFYSNNDVRGFLAQVANTGEDYYEMTYAPPNQSDGTKLRHIRIAISRPGCRLAYRRSYYLSALSEPLPAEDKLERELLAIPGVIQPDDKLYVYMQHGAPVIHDLLFSVHVDRARGPHHPSAAQVAMFAQEPAYFTGNRKKPNRSLSRLSLETYKVDFHVAASQLGQAPAISTDRPITIEFALAAFDEDGVMLNSVVKEADVILPRVKDRRAQVVTLEDSIDIPVKGAWLRFAVRDRSAGRIGAMEIPLKPRTRRNEFGATAR